MFPVFTFVNITVFSVCVCVCDCRCVLEVCRGSAAGFKFYNLILLLSYRVCLTGYLSLGQINSELCLPFHFCSRYAFFLVNLFLYSKLPLSLRLSVS